MAIVLDAWALLALLNDEPAGAAVEQVWLEEQPMMCSVNLGEALYVLIRAHGEEAGARAIEKARAEIEVVDPGWSTVAEAARIKVGGGLSYADCFALATARLHDAALWTGDPEIVAQSHHSAVEVVDLRERRS